MSKRNYIFESDNADFSIYAHFIDFQTKTILLKNNNISAIRIFRNFRLRKLIQINYSNACMTSSNANIAELTIKHSKQSHKLL